MNFEVSSAGGFRLVDRSKQPPRVTTMTTTTTHPATSNFNLRTSYLESPCGPLRLAATDTHLRRVDFVGGKNCPTLPDAPAAENHPVLNAAAAQLADYFAQRRHGFDLPLDPAGTAFQKRVWAALTAIPYGETRSYGDLARAIDNPAACRAVGAANGRNPISIVVPCHRVIGASGSLTGFGGGLDAKRVLLDLETRRLPAPFAQ